MRLSHLKHMKVLKHRVYAIRVEMQVQYDEDILIFDAFAFPESQESYDSFFTDIKINDYDDESFIKNYGLDVYKKLLLTLYDYYQTKVIPESEFLNYHCTGHIDDESYDDVSFDFPLDDYPYLIREFIDKTGEVIEFRKYKDKNNYVKKDENGEIMRGENKLALKLSEEEILEKNLPLYQAGATAFNKKGECIAYSSDEFSSDGVWVREDYQRRGIGLELLIELRSSFKDSRRMGQMTSQGIELACAYFRKHKR